MTIQQYYLGCPVWSNKAWVGELFASSTKPASFLAQYASVFNTVEGNTTFYGMPTPSTVAKWREEAPPTFQFCFKFPRTITHDKKLRNTEAETALFLETLAPLESRLGPYLIQLPPSLGVSDLPALESFLRALPDVYQYNVEVRHPDFYDDGIHEEAVNAILRDLAIDRVHMDTRALRAAPPEEGENTAAAQRRKPNLPTRFYALSDLPMVRYISRPTADANDLWLTEWADVVARWITEGKTPYFFVHAPDDFYAPRIARRFHQLLSQRADVGYMPPWPAEAEELPPAQLSLF